jgi:hypothetical protein
MPISLQPASDQLQPLVRGCLNPCSINEHPVGGEDFRMRVQGTPFQGAHDSHKLGATRTFVNWWDFL